MIVSRIKKRLDRRKRYKTWRANNANNNTAPMNDFDQEAVTVGDYTYGGIRVYNFNVNSKLVIGKFCSIADDVMFILDADHRIDTISTYPFKVNILKTDRFEATTKGDIIVDDDVWIGFRATIMSGVHIGQGAVIAAGAVVTKDVPPYTIVGGVPARVIKNRFTKDVIEYLLTLNYHLLSEDMIKQHHKELYTAIDKMSLDEIKKMYSWFPKTNS